jgi:hypothetical protein
MITKIYDMDFEIPIDTLLSGVEIKNHTNPISIKSLPTMVLEMRGKFDVIQKGSHVKCNSVILTEDYVICEDNNRRSLLLKRDGMIVVQ